MKHFVALSSQPSKINSLAIPGSPWPPDAALRLPRTIPCFLLFCNICRINENTCFVWICRISCRNGSKSVGYVVVPPLTPLANLSPSQKSVGAMLRVTKRWSITVGRRRFHVGRETGSNKTADPPALGSGFWAPSHKSSEYWIPRQNRIMWHRGNSSYFKWALAESCASIGEICCSKNCPRCDDGASISKFYPCVDWGCKMLDKTCHALRICSCILCSVLSNLSSSRHWPSFCAWISCDVPSFLLSKLVSHSWCSVGLPQHFRSRSSSFSFVFGCALVTSVCNSSFGWFFLTLPSFLFSCIFFD